MDFTTRRERYRRILAGDKCVYPGSVFDPISARIAEDLGFEVGMFAGSIASGTVLGAPDLIVLTLTEFAQQIHRICRAGDLSLMVDADHGYGNALNVMRTVEELETAGVAAATVGTPCEDVDAAARRVIDDAGHGEHFVHRTGHGIGVEAHEHPNIVAGNELPLAVGHAFSVEPGIYVPGVWGARLEDIVVATADGPVAMNQIDHGLAVVDG